MNPYTTQRDWGWLIAAAFPLFGILPTLAPGVMDAADAPLHVQRIFAMGTLLASGEVYPRWVSWFHLGYGYPIFNFYPPGVFYLGGLLMQTGLGAVWAFHAIAAAAWVWGTVGAYRLGRLFLPGTAALVGAALWAYAPSRLFEVWTQGSLPQMMSAAFIPWVLLTVITAAFRPSRRGAVWVALALFGLVMTHQPITFITALVVAPLTVILIIVAAWGQWQTIVRRALCVYGGLLLGAGLAMIFLLPMVLELRLVAAVGGTDDLIPYLRSNFLTWQEALAHPTPPDLTDVRVMYPRTLGALGLLLFGVGLGRLLASKRWQIASLLTGGAAFVIYMLLPASEPIWLGVPYLAQLRFSERFLRMGAVVIAMGGAASVLWLPARWRWAGAVGLVGLIIGVMLPLTVPSQPIVDYPQMSALTEIEFERATYTLGTTSYNEFNPRWGESVPLDPPVDPQIYVTMPQRIYPLRHWPYQQLTPQSFRLTVTDEPEQVVIRQFYYPGWVATLNGDPVPIEIEPEYGLIAVQVPPGEHTIALRYRGTTAQRVGVLLTLISAVIALGVYQTGKPQTPLTTPAGIGPGPILAAVPIMITLAGVWWQVILPHTGWFRLASPPDEPAYMRTTYPATFGDTFTLLGYTLADTDIRPNDPLRITLFWRPTMSFDGQRVRAVVQLVNLNLTETWAVSQPVFLGGGHTDSPNYTPARFTSDPHTLRLFDHAKPYTAQIMVQLVDARSGDPLQLPDGSDRVLLPEPVTVGGAGESVERQLAYTAGEGLALWCAAITPDSATDTLTLTLYWYVTAELERDLTTFVHGLDANGALITQADRPPIPAYPTRLWRPGQTLAAQHTLSISPQLETVAVGLYDATGARLPIYDADGNRLPNDQVQFSLMTSECEPG